jgi:TPP-dependent indolepyruvate ferredoxin oxidoreductase alpha subunit
MTTWIRDESGNRCSVERWGSEEKARAALASNKGCSDCSDCSRCSGCRNIASLSDKKNLQAEPNADGTSPGEMLE